MKLIPILLFLISTNVSAGVSNSADPVTSNAGTNLNTSALALQSGINPNLDRSGSGSISSTGGSVVVTTNGLSTVTFQVSGTWVGLLILAGSVDGGVTYPSAINFNLQAGGDQTFFSVNGVYSALVAAFDHVQIVTFGSWTSGTANITWNGGVGIGKTNLSVSAPSLFPLNTTNVGGTKLSYSACVQNAAIVATPTDIFTLTGSASRTIRIVRFLLSGTQTTTLMRDFFLVKRSAANTGGTSSAVTAVPNDSNNGAATATALSYTANPTLGTTVGTVRLYKYEIPTTTGANSQSPLEVKFGDTPEQAIVLRGTSQVLALNLNSITPTGASLNMCLEWTEE